MSVKKWIVLAVVLAGLVLSVGLAVQASPPGQQGDVGAQGGLGTAFTYQGRLESGGQPVDDTCDMDFRLYDAGSGGSQVGSAIAIAVPVVGGLFTVHLDFGSSTFNGDARWLGIRVQCPGDAAYVNLGRQALTATPYALYAASAWQLEGNAGTRPGVDYLGTSDGVTLTLAVSGTAALRLVPHATSPNVIGGHSANSVAAGVAGATIGGGGDGTYPNRVMGNYATVAGGESNTASGWYAAVGGGLNITATGDYATVGGGVNNAASGSRATVGGGKRNTASGSRATVSGGEGNTASNDYATVGGGYYNDASGGSAAVGGGVLNTASGSRATIAGGESNTASYDYATVGGGYHNDASDAVATVGGGASNTASGSRATIAGGEGNTASYDYATVGGGYHNDASDTAATVGGGWYNAASGPGATVAGGSSNTASGYAATVGGGLENTAAGGYSFAAGRRAKANNQGCFVWGDSTYADVTCDNDNRWVARASGGVYFYTNSTLDSGSRLLAGGSAWGAVSDRARKESFEPVDTQELLARLARIEISTWNYLSQDPSIRHIGPMAQDFNALLPDLGGEGEEYINSLDADGVALAAVQGLYELSQEQAVTIETMAAENSALAQQVDELAAQRVALQQQLDALSARVEAIEAGSPGGMAPLRFSQNGMMPGAGIVLLGLGLALSLPKGLAWLKRRGTVLFLPKEGEG